LTLVASAASAAGYAASDWTDYGKPRPAALSNLLKSQEKEPLDAASGGQSYRLIQGASVTRLDIAADGRATLNATGKPSANLSNAKLEAFLAALDASRFKTAASAPALAEVCSNDIEISFEALVDDRYRAVAECGDPLGLKPALDVLRAG
jgi:hypothetical protein